MASHSTYSCDFCGGVIEQRDYDNAALGVRVARANCPAYVTDEGDCCKRCQMILTNAMREAIKRCKEARRG